MLDMLPIHTFLIHSILQAIVETVERYMQTQAEPKSNHAIAVNP